MLDAQQIERIVSQVLEQLQQPVLRAPSAVAAAPASNVRPVPAPIDGVSVPERVITQDVIQALAAGTKRIRIVPRAIITPAARDVLKSRGIECVSETASAGTTAAVRWQMLHTVPVKEAGKLLDDSASAGAKWDRRLLGLSAEAAREAVSALCRAEAAGVVVLSADPEVVVCLANRNTQVRGAVAAGTACITRIRRSLGANLIAINPAGKSYFELRNLLRAIVAPGAPAVPNGWNH